MVNDELESLLLLKLLRRVIGVIGANKVRLLIPVN